MIVNAGLRRFNAGGQGGILRSASFYAPLTRSLILSRGTGSPTYTGGVATGSGVLDNEGVLRMRVSGQAGFTGARIVANAIQKSQALATAPWAAMTSGTATNNAALAPDGTMTASSLIEAAATTQHTLSQASVAAVGGHTYLLSCYAEYAGRRYVSFDLTDGATGGVYAYFDLQTGVISQAVVAGGSWTNGYAAIIPVGSGRYRLVIRGTLGSAQTTASPSFYLSATATGPETPSYAGDGVSGIYVWGVMREDITGRADQTTPSEYVSVGVLSAPWHGAGIDGVKNFPTDLLGNPLTTMKGYLPEAAATNLCLQSNALTAASWVAAGTPAATQNAIGPDGATSAWTLTDNDVGSYEDISQAITLTAVTHTFSVFVKKTTGAQASYPLLFAYDGGTQIALCTIDTSNGVATVWSAYTGLTVQTSTASCVSYNALYWRVSLTFLATVASWTHFLVPAATTNATQSTGVIDTAAQGSAVFYGAQVELGSVATIYIPTTTLAVTRAKDLDSTPTSGNITAAAGTLALTFTPTHAPIAATTIALWGTYVDASNYTAILHDGTNLIFRQRIGGVNTDATKALNFASGTSYKICASWGAGGQTLYVAGVAGTPHANTTAAQIAATMQFGADGNSLQQPGCAIKDAFTWLRQLSGSEQAAITS